MAGLLTLRDWLAAHGVTQVTMEATGVYWKPVWAILEDEFELLLVNARHVKQVPGRKPGSCIKRRAPGWPGRGNVRLSRENGCSRSRLRRSPKW